MKTIYKISDKRISWNYFKSEKITKSFSIYISFQHLNKVLNYESSWLNFVRKENFISILCRATIVLFGSSHFTKLKFNRM